MKKIICIFVAFILSNIALSQTITLTYDAAGNRISKQITASIAPPAIIGDSVVCQGTTVTFNAHGGVTYLWSNGATDSVISFVADTSISYKVYAYNAIGCVDSNTKHLTVLPVPITGAIMGLTNINLALHPTDTYTVALHPGSYYTWTVSNGTILSGYGTNQLVIQWYAAGTGTISVYEMVDSGACNTLPVTVPDTVYGMPTTGIDATAAEMQFKVYPSPASNEVWLDYLEMNCNEVTVSIVNIIGQVIYQRQYLGNNSFHLKLDGAIFITSGIYTVQLQSPSHSSTRKITVIK